MSSTKYLDELLLDAKGLVTKEVMSEIKGYCGLFAFILSVVNSNRLSDEAKVNLINSILDFSIKFMYRKHEANLDLYMKQVSSKLEVGKLFATLSDLPAQMREDFEMGIEEARHFLRVEAQDILSILKVNLTL